MRIKFISEYSGDWGEAAFDEVRVVSLDAGKWLVRNGYAIATDELANDEIITAEVIQNKQPQPQVFVVPVPGGQHYETLPHDEEE